MQQDAQILADLLDLVAFAAEAADYATESCSAPRLHTVLAQSEAQIREWAGASGVLQRGTLDHSTRQALQTNLLEIQRRAQRLRGLIGGNVLVSGSGGKGNDQAE
jgi:hypothetical protein